MERKYFVKENYRTNVASMSDHVRCCQYDIEDGKTDSVELMGETMDYDRLLEFREELDDLISVMHGKVTGEEYERIKAISDERNLIRYNICLAKGMNEDDAAYAFLD